MEAGNCETTPDRGFGSRAIVRPPRTGVFGRSDNGRSRYTGRRPGPGGLTCEKFFSFQWGEHPEKIPFSMLARYQIPSHNKIYDTHIKRDMSPPRRGFIFYQSLLLGRGTKHAGPNKYIISGFIVVMLCTSLCLFCFFHAELPRKWDGPYRGFISFGNVSTTVLSLSAAQEACLEVRMCVGVTGYSTRDGNWVWDVRYGSQTWVQPSIRTHEISWRLNPPMKRLSFYGLPHISLSFIYIGLPRRRVERANVLLADLGEHGLDPSTHVQWYPGIEGRQFTKVEDILAVNMYTPVSNWTSLCAGLGPVGQCKSLSRLKGKIANWLAHMNVWRNLLKKQDKKDWTVVLEDDVVMVDSSSRLKEKIQHTVLLFPSVEIIYLTGRELPSNAPNGALRYVGSDAYALRSMSAAKFLELCDLANEHVTTSAIDKYLSELSIAETIIARQLVGGNAFTNRWTETASDVDV